MYTQFAPTDVVVVGGGLAGLSAAAHLARAGVAVTLFEKAAGLGGRAATQTHDGYHFNRGAHALYPGGATARSLRELNIPYKGGSPTGLLGLRQGTLGVFPATPLALAGTDLLGAADKRDLTRLLVVLALGKPATLGRVSIQAWIDGHTRRPRVRQVLAALARTVAYSAALDQVSAELFATQMQLSLKHNVVYVDGGWGTLVAGLRRAATQAGAHILSAARVEAVEHQDGRVQGVCLRDGRTLRAAAVIVATEPRDAAALVDGGAYPALRRIVEPMVPIEVACLDVALRRLPVPRQAVVFDLDRPRFATTQSLFAQITPPGGALIHTLKYLDPARPSDPREDERDLEDLLDTMQPGWREEVVKRIYLPRMSAASALPSARAGGFAGRPGPRVPGLAGLYLAGDWIGAEGHLADAAMASARRVAQLLLQGDLAALRAGVQAQPIAAGS